MPLIDLNSKPSPTMQRWFGLSLAAFLGLLAWLLPLPTSGQIALGCIAALVAVAYYAVRSLQIPTIRGWQYLTFPIAFVVSHLLLLLTYYCVFLPIGLLLRATGYDPLHLKAKSSDDSTWIPKSPKSDAASYFKQY